jgi:hypothetical protein
MIGLGIAVSIISFVWVLAEAVMAWRDGMFTARQMEQKYRNHFVGLPFVWHFGMWGDLFIITPILGLIVARYGDQWSAAQVLHMGGVGILLSAAMHFIYTLTPFPDSLAWRKEMSPAGWMHLVYQGSAFAVIGLLYFCTESVSPQFLVAASAALTVHVAIASHVLLGLLDRLFSFRWCPDFINKPDPWITIAVTAVLLFTVTFWR